VTAPREDIIPREAADTLWNLFRERVRRTPDNPACRFYDALNGAWTDYSWAALERDVRRWQAALHAEELESGDRVAIMARNSRFWITFDQAAMSLGLVTVPIYTEDRADNVGYIIDHADVKLLLIGGAEQWQRLDGALKDRRGLRRIVSIADLDDIDDRRFLPLSEWLRCGRDGAQTPPVASDDLATIVYTSGTTGRPKGVMLSHRNILSNVWHCLQIIEVETRHVFLSFLPLSHTLERTVGYYLPVMAGAVIAHSRGIPELAHDLRSVRPDGIISVPRIYERVYGRIRDSLAQQRPAARWLFDLAVRAGWHRFECSQGRARRGPLWFLWPPLKRLVADKVTRRLGGNLQVAVSGGAALSPEIARVFIALGVPILQGYGLTEASPVVSVNRPDRNMPSSIGPPLPGVEVRIGDDDELLVKGENVMLGYWKDPQETRRVIDAGGWLHTGDKARIDDGYIYITGRIKDIIVLANGEKVSPGDMETVLAGDPMFDQVMIIGEGRPFLSALAVLNETQWRRFTHARGMSGTSPIDKAGEQALLERMSVSLHEFPGYAQIYRLTCISDPWTVDNGLLTPTMKTKRAKILERFAEEVEKMYEGHA
jgi:long-chain acyl-CoA synthetase